LEHKCPDLAESISDFTSDNTTSHYLLQVRRVFKVIRGTALEAMHSTLAIFVITLTTASSSPGLRGNRSLADDRCFNSGARAGVECSGGTGYNCPADNAYACMDWTFGSSAMRAAEAAHGGETFFGVGTFGISSDPQRGLGACYRLKVAGVGKDIIAQSINTGTDVAGNQFDLMMGAGGVGSFNNCAGGSNSMFAGSKEVWGCQYGGIDSSAECKNLPAHPREHAAGDSLRQLCEYSFSKRVRLSGEGLPAGKCKYNPTLLDVGRVPCPSALVELTQMQRSDEPSSYQRVQGFPNSDKECLSFDPAAHDYEPAKISAYCLTRMMDCRKPSGGWTSNVKEELMVPGKRVVQPCTEDGYTRIDVQCGCKNNMC